MSDDNFILLNIEQLKGEIARLKARQKSLDSVVLALGIAVGALLAKAFL